MNSGKQWPEQVLFHSHTLQRKTFEKLEKKYAIPENHHIFFLQVTHFWKAWGTDPIFFFKHTFLGWLAWLVCCLSVGLAVSLFHLCGGRYHVPLWPPSRGEFDSPLPPPMCPSLMLRMFLVSLFSSLVLGSWLRATSSPHRDYMPELCFTESSQEFTLKSPSQNRKAFRVPYVYALLMCMITYIVQIKVFLGGKICTCLVFF